MPVSPLMRRGIVLCLLFSLHAAAADRWGAISAGPHAVGFRFQPTLDPTRNMNSRSRGTPLGLAIWYPAGPPPVHARPVTQLEYRLLAFSRSPDNPSKQAFVDSETDMMVAWRHVGIVPLTRDQARASLDTCGRAVRGAAPAPGKFPVVLILGGAWYLSTTAEILASHGYLVVAAVRFSDRSDEIPTANFSWSVENSVRDAEWALAEITRDPAADTAHVSAIGHGAGGMQALVLTMRNRAIRAVANVDSGIFSTRTNPRQLLFYDPRLLTVPYLYIATAATKRDSDQFRDFEQMRFSRRYEVVLENTAILHHDLSDIGRAVSAPLGLRGDIQDAVLQHYADVQQMLVRFLDSHGRAASADAAGLSQWLQQLGHDHGYTFTLRDSVEPAPTTVDVLASLDDRSPQRLREAHGRDPEAPLFSEDEIQRVVIAARTRNQPALAVNLARFALELHPQSLPVQEQAVVTLEFAGDRAAALDIARHCVSLELPRNDWRALDAQTKCRQQLSQLQ